MIQSRQAEPFRFALMHDNKLTQLKFTCFCIGSVTKCILQWKSIGSLWIEKHEWENTFFLILFSLFFQIKPLIFPPLRWGISCTNLLMFIQDAVAAFPRNEPSKVWLHIIEFHWMDRGVIHQKFIPFNKTFVTICQSHKLRHFPRLQLKRHSD